MTPRQLFEHHHVLGSNVLIRLLEGNGPLADAAGVLIDGIEDGLATGVLAGIALTEVLSRPAALGDGRLFQRYAEELRAVPNLRIVALDPEIAIDAAWGRGGGRDLGDADPCRDRPTRGSELLRHQRWPHPGTRARADRAPVRPGHRRPRAGA